MKTLAWFALALPLAGQHIVAHRGGAPENTLQAIRESVALGVRVELDVRQTRDGVLVLLHDQTLERTQPGRQGRVGDFTLAQTGLPTLEEALELGAIPDIDFKAGDPVTLVAMLRRFDLLSRATVSCEDPAIARALRGLHLRLPLPSGPNGLAVLFAESDPPIVTIEWSQFRPELVSKLHAAGREVFLSMVGPGDKEPNWQAARAAAVDYLETDHAAEALRIVN